MPKHTVAYSLSAALKQLADDREQRVLELDRWAEIGDSGATEIANALRTNEHLEVLILGSQHIGPAGAQALGEALRKHMRLKELHLHNNKLGYAGVAKLAEELALPLSANSSRPGNKILEVLVLRNNAVGPHCPSGSVCTACRFSPNFPASLLELTSLRLIDLNTNELISVPHDIAKMPKLIGLDIRKNAIENIPDQVMERLLENMNEAEFRTATPHGVVPGGSLLSLEQLIHEVYLPMLSASSATPAAAAAAFGA